MVRVRAEDLLVLARKELGYKENPPRSNMNKYGAWFRLNGVPWCMIHVMWLFNRLDALDLLPCRTASCGQFMRAAQKAGNWITSGYRSGDVLIFTFSKSRIAEHCGIVESVKADGTIVTIEGNTAVGNNSNGGEVMRRERKPSAILGAFRPAYAEQKHVALVAQECADGKGGWGTGATRKAKLAAAGYDPAAVQKLVNALFSDGIPATVKVKTYLSIRAKPDADSRELDRYRSGQSVRITEVQAGKGASAWGRVRSGGWISLDFVEIQEG